MVIVRDSYDCWCYLDYVMTHIVLIGASIVLLLVALSDFIELLDRRNVDESEWTPPMCIAGVAICGLVIAAITF